MGQGWVRVGSGGREPLGGCYPRAAASLTHPLICPTPPLSVVTTKIEFHARPVDTILQSCWNECGVGMSAERVHSGKRALIKLRAPPWAMVMVVLD